MGYIGIAGHMGKELKAQFLAKLGGLPCKYADVLDDECWSTFRGGSSTAVLVIDSSLFRDPHSMWQARWLTIEAWNSGRRRFVVCLLDIDGLEDNNSWIVESVKKYTNYCAIGIDDSAKMIKERWDTEGCQ